ncbi:response regulator transcription factor [Desulfococcaceae bacterium HSG8]|nr:response regulator transcription factor [Desulfococcaceae bacterium HSG8]
MDHDIPFFTHYALRITHYALRIIHYATHHVSRFTFHGGYGMEKSEWVRMEGSIADNRNEKKKKKARVVLADDEAVVRLIMKKVMKGMNCEIVGEAKNGQEAVDLFREKNPDILLLDINMPFKTGKEALKEIIREFPDSFVIMLTSLADTETVEDCLKLGAANYIRKDTRLEDMKKIIRTTWAAFKKQ